MKPSWGRPWSWKIVSNCDTSEVHIGAAALVPSSKLVPFRFSLGVM